RTYGFALADAFLRKQISAIQLHTFLCKQRTLARHTPTIARYGPIAAHNTMARNGYRQHIGRASAAHGAHRARHTQTLGEFGVAAGLTRWDGAKGPPHFLLECRSADIQFNHVLRGPAVKEGNNLIQVMA